MTTDSTDYRTSHLGDDHGKKYDESIFKIGDFDYEMWKKEQVILKHIISKYKIKGRLLDFACGSGRIISFLEEYFSDPIGLDISPDMLKQAKQKVKKANLVCEDATKKPEIIEGTFDCITSFRFFLNAQKELRDQALCFISNKLKDENSIFIFNIHGNKYSTRWFLVLFDRIFKNNIENQMSLKEIREMLAPHDLEIIEYFGIGFIYKVFYKFMPKFLWVLSEKIFYSLPFLKPISLYFIFVCRKKITSPPSKII